MQKSPLPYGEAPQQRRYFGRLTRQVGERGGFGNRPRGRSPQATAAEPARCGADTPSYNIIYQARSDGAPQSYRSCKRGIPREVIRRIALCAAG
jgi:hypothetical protein